MKKNILIYCSSRNNYEMLEKEIIPNYNLKNIEYDFINIDDNSSEEQFKLGNQICKDNNVKMIKNNGRGLFKALQTVVDYIEENNLNYSHVVWVSHDTYPLTNDFFDKLNDLAELGKLDKFGCIGFNTIWKKYTCSEEDFVKKNLEGNYCGVLGRAVLTPVPGAGWYRPSDIPLAKKSWGFNVAVESIVDMVMMFNIKNYKKFIECDPAYHHFCWGDDICLQFLKNNVYNVTLFDFYIYHDQNIKKKYKIPVNSATAAKKGDNYYFCDYGDHLNHWNKKWGFDREWQKKKNNIICEVQKLHGDSLIESFSMHDVSLGPLKTFNIK